MKRTRHKALTTQLHTERVFDRGKGYRVIISGRLRSDWKMVSSDAQAACEFVRSKPLLDCLYSRFSDCGYAADNPRAVPFAAVPSNPKPSNRRAGVAAGEPCGGRLVPAREHPSQKRIASVGRVFQRSRGLHGRPICSPQGQWARPCLTGSIGRHNPQIPDSPAAGLPRVA